MSNSVQVDHEETAAFIAKLRTIAEDMQANVPTLVKQVVDSFTREASVGSRDGSVIPLYQSADTAMRDVMTKMERQMLAIAAVVASDADALESAAAGIKDSDDNGSANVEKSDTNLLGGVGDIGGETVYKPNDYTSPSGVVGDMGGQPTYKTGGPAVDSAALVADWNHR